MNIYYFHGFASCYKPNSAKVQALKKYFPDAKFPNHSFEYHKESFQDELKNIAAEIGKLDPQKTMLVGTSLGGFMALYFGRAYGIRHHVFNPSYKPSETLRKYLGRSVDNYAIPGETIKLNQSAIDIFKGLEEKMKLSLMNPEHCHVYLGTQDELIDYKKSQAFFKALEVEASIHVDDHRFSKNFELIVESLNKGHNNE